LGAWLSREATARTIWACWRVWRHSPVWVSHTLLEDTGVSDQACPHLGRVGLTRRSLRIRWLQA
jgi:hypothetical protein